MLYSSILHTVKTGMNFPVSLHKSQSFEHESSSLKKSFCARTSDTMVFLTHYSKVKQGATIIMCRFIVLAPLHIMHP